MHSVSVIIPTRALAQRGARIRRAVASVQSQQGVRSVPILVINGTDRDPALTQELQADPALRVTTLETASLPAALCRGRELVDTAWFSELDDDDLLLPGALATRIHALEERPRDQVLITNGLVRGPGGDVPVMSDVASVRRDPLRALLRGQWLLPGAWLCRTDEVDGSLFEGMPASLECTYLAVRFATGYRIGFLDLPTVVWHSNSPDALSGTRSWVLGQIDALRRILELELPADVRLGFRAKLSATRHELADLHWRQGDLGEAWRWHIRSLRGSGGWRYLPFSRRLLARPPRKGSA